MSHRLSGVACVVASLAVLASCGGGTPTAPTPTATSITVSSLSTHLFLGVTETFTATVTLSNGTTQPLVGGTWGTDAAGVATVGASTGLVTSQSSGEVTVFVDAQGVRGSKRVTVVPNYAGIRSGSYVVTSCNQTDGWVPEDLCGVLFQVGASLPVAFNLQQTAGTVTGQTSIGQAVSSPFTATIAANGSLTFSALAIIAAPGVNISVNQAWQINMTQPGRIDGTFVQTITDPSLTGQVVVGATLTGVTSSVAFDRAAFGGARPQSIGDLVASTLRGR